VFCEGYRPIRRRSGQAPAGRKILDLLHKEIHNVNFFVQKKKQYHFCSAGGRTSPNVAILPMLVGGSLTATRRLHLVKNETEQLMTKQSVALFCSVPSAR
jgi:hypothetical protein